jgi:hypothetical protein
MLLFERAFPTTAPNIHGVRQTDLVLHSREVCVVQGSGYKDYFLPKCEMFKISGCGNYWNHNTRSAVTCAWPETICLTVPITRCEHMGFYERKPNLQPVSAYVLHRCHFRLWRWKRSVKKNRALSELYEIAIQKTVHFVVSAVMSSIPTKKNLIHEFTIEKQLLKKVTSN